MFETKRVFVEQVGVFDFLFRQNVGDFINFAEFETEFIRTLAKSPTLCPKRVLPITAISSIGMFTIFKNWL